MAIVALARSVHTLTAAVADDGTFTTAYPAGTDQDFLTGSVDGEIVVGENDTWAQGDPGFEFTFGASVITVTNRTGATLPAASSLSLSFGERSINGSYNLTNPAQAQAAIDAL